MSARRFDHVIFLSGLAIFLAGLVAIVVNLLRGRAATFEHAGQAALYVGNAAIWASLLLRCLRR